MSLTQDYYAILGVSPTAEPEDVKSAYRRAARRFHPDVNTNPGAAAQFRDIARAYEVLGNWSARQEYDIALRREGLPPNYFSLRVTPSKRTLKMMTENQVLYVLLEIIPDSRFQGTNKSDTPLNLALVIDRSTSMNGPRLERVKQAVHRIIDNLAPQDTLSIVTFSDRAEIIVSANDKRETSTLKAVVSTVQASGATEILQGLQAGVKELQHRLNPKNVNHLILLTDGHTYGDEEECLALAESLAEEGIGISGIGIGQEWNDTFLDKLASVTGGASTYINSPSAIVTFLNDRVRSLGAAFADRLRLSIAPDPDVTLESIFKISPNPQPLPLEQELIPLGGLEAQQPISILVQYQMPPLEKQGFRTVARLDVTGDMMQDNVLGYKVVSDFSVETAETAPAEDPPTSLLDAMGKLTLYRMQEKAQEAILRGDVQEATRRLEMLATRLFANGENHLARAAMAEAQRVAQTSMLSEEGQKTLKYGTRALLSAASFPSLLAGNDGDNR